jgi:uncharacterized protein YkwD
MSGIALLGFSPRASAADLADKQALTGPEESLLDAINRARAARGIRPLRIGMKLQRAARAHSRAMVRSGSFTHGNWFHRLRTFGVEGRVFGETIAWGAGGEPSAAAIVGMWLASPSHRDTMLKRGFRRIGVGIAVGSTSHVATADFAG